MERLPVRDDGAPDLPGGWISEGPLPKDEPFTEPDWLAGFPSEVPPPEHESEPQVPSAPVGPSEAEIERLFPPVQPIPLIAPRLLRAAVLVLVTIIMGTTGAVIVLKVLFPAPSLSESVVPTSATPDVVANEFGSLPTRALPPPIQEAQSASAPSPPRETPRVRPRHDVAVAGSIVARPGATLVASRATAAVWPGATAPVPAMTPSPTPVDTPVPPAFVAPPVASPPPTREPALVTAPPASPPASTPETSARIAKTASIQSVLDRYRDTFDSLDANGVEAFWPGVDRRALDRAFAQLESQRLQFDHCDINLAGARAFASCNGYAQFTRKAGSRDVRFEPRLWTFTLGEVKNGWVILGVEARQGR